MNADDPEGMLRAAIDALPETSRELMLYCINFQEQRGLPAEAVALALDDVSKLYAWIVDAIRDGGS